MKLLVITDSYPPHHSGGYELRCKNIVENLREFGHNVTVITSKCPDTNCDKHSHEENILRKLNKRFSKSFITKIVHDYKDIKNINNVINSFKPDIVYIFHLINLSNAIFPFLNRKDIPIVYDEGGSGLLHTKKVHSKGLYFYINEQNSTLKKLIKRWANQFIFHLSGKLLVTKWSWPDNLTVYYNSYGGLKYSIDNNLKITGAQVVYSGIDTSVFTFKKRNNFSNNTNIIVPGRIYPAKGTLDALLLLKMLNDSNINATLTLVGLISDKEYNQQLQEFITKNKLKELVRYIPMIKQEDIVPLYHESDICFFPSKGQYGFSRVPLEAMACGAIVFTYGNEGSREVVLNNETGFIIDEGDLSAVVSLIRSLIHNPELAARIAINARGKIENKYCLKKYIEEIMTILNKVHQTENLSL